MVLQRVLNIILGISCAIIMLSDLLGWLITYDYIKLSVDMNVDYNYFDVFDIAKSSGLFGYSLLVYCLFRKINQLKELRFFKHISGVWMVYYMIALIGDVYLINEEGNWIVLISAALFFYIVSLMSNKLYMNTLSIFSKWGYQIKSYFMRMVR